MITTYLGDVSTELGNATVSTVYVVTTQYWDNTARAAGGSSFSNLSNVYLDSDALPSPNCTDSAPGVTACVTDAQIQQEIDAVVAKQGWPRGLGAIYLLVTPPALGSCGDASLGCYDVPNGYCAYHGDFNLKGHGETLYATIPYGAVPGCDTDPNPNGTNGERPNNNPPGNNADPTINLISHEQIETITDPVGSNLAWVDTDSTPTSFCGSKAPYCYGSEIGDLCAFDYGSPSGTHPGMYNQTLGARNYYLQGQWSNNGAVCSHGVTSPVSAANGSPIAGTGAPSSTSGLTYNGGPVVHANTVYVIYWNPVGVVPTAAIGGGAGFYYPADQVPLAGSSSDASATFTWDFGDGQSGTGPSVSHAYGAPGSYTVTLTASNSAGSTQARQQVVVHARTPPSPAFTISSLTPAAGQVVNFDGGSSFDPPSGGGITGWSWDFGDGAQASGQTVSHAFASNGSRAVTLTVTDAAGQSAAVTQTVQVQQVHTKALMSILLSRTTTRRDLVGKGLTVAIRCDGSCSARARLLLQVTSSKNARHARAKLVDIAHVSGTADASGSLRLTLKLTSDGKRRLRQQRKPAVIVMVNSGINELSQTIHPR